MAVTRTKVSINLPSIENTSYETHNHYIFYTSFITCHRREILCFYPNQRFSPKLSFVFPPHFEVMNLSANALCPQNTKKPSSLKLETKVSTLRYHSICRPKTEMCIRDSYFTCQFDYLTFSVCVTLSPRYFFSAFVTALISVHKKWFFCLLYTSFFQCEVHQ